MLNQSIEELGTTKPEGTGLGLWSIYKIVKASQGRLYHANRPQGGAVVTVELPQA